MSDTPMNTEIRAIRVCVRMLQMLDKTARRRVVDYLHSRYSDKYGAPEPVEPLLHCPVDGQFIRTEAPHG